MQEPTVAQRPAWTRTPFSIRLGLDYPLVQGPLGGLFSQPLTAAVSNFGGLGSFGAHGLAPSAIKDVIAEIRALTSKPFAMNLWVSMEDQGAAASGADAFARSLSPLAGHIKTLGVALPSYAQRHEESGYAVRSYDVACTTLDRICADSSFGTLHFLKIDVEGSEKAVLEGFSFDEVRPWVVVIEATEPKSSRPVFSEWEWLLVARRYQFAYFDGLNRFYVAKEHGDLARRLSSASLWGWRLRQLVTNPRKAVPMAIRRIRTK